ncbi:MAG: hypothetical protein M3020_00715 [Myxococcota bacterium]|nr:hypothetical protein [Myxococcota bacterium]
MSAEQPTSPSEHWQNGLHGAFAAQNSSGLNGKWVMLVHWWAINVLPKNDPSCPVLALESET